MLVFVVVYLRGCGLLCLTFVSFCYDHRCSPAQIYFMRGLCRAEGGKYDKCWGFYGFDGWGGLDVC